MARKQARRQHDTKKLRSGIWERPRRRHAHKKYPRIVALHRGRHTWGNGLVPSRPRVPVFCLGVTGSRNECLVVRGHTQEHDVARVACGAAGWTMRARVSKHAACPVPERCALTRAVAVWMARQPQSAQATDPPNFCAPPPHTHLRIPRHVFGLARPKARTSSPPNW